MDLNMMISKLQNGVLLKGRCLRPKLRFNSRTVMQIIRLVVANTPKRFYCDHQLICPTN
jgi:hypothetical protein